MLGRVFRTGILAGGAAGTAATLAQWLGTTPMIRVAEVFEHGGGHDHAAAGSLDDPARAVLALAMNLMVGVGFGLMLAGAMAAARRPVDIRSGVLWGALGFLAFALLPALGLPPELPGMPAAALTERQLWWLLAVVCSAFGLAALALGRKPAWWIAGAAALLLPHLIGGPEAPALQSALPADLIARYVAVSLVTSLLFWLVLGASLGALEQRSR